MSFISYFGYFLSTEFVSPHKPLLQSAEIEEDLPDVLRFKPGTDLHAHPLVASGHLILQVDLPQTTGQTLFRSPIPHSHSKFCRSPHIGNSTESRANFIDQKIKELVLIIVFRCKAIFMNIDSFTLTILITTYRVQNSLVDCNLNHFDIFLGGGEEVSHSTITR